jgi:ribosome-associated protein
VAPSGRATRRPAATKSAAARPEAEPPAAEPVAVRLPITLGQFLKVSQLASTGGEAKTLIALGAVRVNGLVEQRRGRKLVGGDQVDTGAAAALVQAVPSDAAAGSST